MQFHIHIDKLFLRLPNIEDKTEQTATVQSQTTSSYHETLYESVKAAVKKLYTGINNPVKREAIEYVLQIFTVHEQDHKPGPTAGETVKLNNQSEAMKKAWETRRANAARKAQELLNEPL